MCVYLYLFVKRNDHTYVDANKNLIVIPSCVLYSTTITKLCSLIYLLKRLPGLIIYAVHLPGML